MIIFKCVTHSSGMIITSILVYLSILKSFRRVSPCIEVGLESTLLALGNFVIYCSFKEFKCLSLVLISDDFLEFHQLFLIKGDTGLLYL
jgi:hypothetical protein